MATWSIDRNSLGTWNTKVSNRNSLYFWFLELAHVKQFFVGSFWRLEFAETARNGPAVVDHRNHQLNEAFARLSIAEFGIEDLRFVESSCFFSFWGNGISQSFGSSRTECLIVALGSSLAQDRAPTFEWKWPRTTKGAKSLEKLCFQWKTKGLALRAATCDLTGLESKKESEKFKT